MTFLEKLDLLIEENELSKRQFAIVSGIPYTTIVSFYKNGYSNIKLSTIISIADFFGVSIDYLVREDAEEIEYTSKRKDITDGLDDSGKEFIKMVIEHEKERVGEILESKEEDDFMMPHAARTSLNTKGINENDINLLKK